MPVGSPAPDLELPDLGGGTLSLGSLRASGKPTLLVFTNLNCSPCQALLPKVGGWQRERIEELTISLISRGEPEKNRTLTDEHGLRNVVLQEESNASESYGVWGTPSAVVVLPDGPVGSPLGAGVEQIETLVSRAAAARLARLERSVSSVAENLRLPYHPHLRFELYAQPLADLLAD